MAAVSPTVQEFRNDLSDLNVFMHTHNVDLNTRFRLREYMHQTARLKHTEAHRTLLTKLSPAMQGEVSLLINKRTINLVWCATAGLHASLLAAHTPHGSSHDHTPHGSSHVI